MIEVNILRLSEPPRIKYQLVGDWEGTIRKLGEEGLIVRRALIAAEYRFAKKIVRLVKGHIRKQDIDWIPLSTDYASRKSDHGHPTDFYRMYDTYLDSITTWKKGDTRFAGVMRGIYGKTLSGEPGKMEVAAYAYLVERDPDKPRPLWDFVFNHDLGGEKGMKDKFRGYLYAELRKRMSNVVVGKFLTNF